ncbi:conserved Plasmodium protein, unknown function [Plasmodium chabaudi chabaudi]|uniref:Uncharacterized protein n=1 Tax=Plasmodium chabaudi chabaudi TaxID=31271 RepID=A0A1D3RR67_PLACU|nr:conserved Plasmodium protein, unknown function [Plasmodium chabaudi chabaudi]
MNRVKTAFCNYYKGIVNKTPLFQIKNNTNHLNRRYISISPIKFDKNNINNNETPNANNLPKATRVPIMRFFYGIIAVMAIVPICQSLYETDKYYKENKHLYEKGSA